MYGDTPRKRSAHPSFRHPVVQSPTVYRASHSVGRDGLGGLNLILWDAAAAAAVVVHANGNANANADADVV